MSKGSKEKRVLSPPPLPEEDIPPVPEEPLPTANGSDDRFEEHQKSDGWQAIYDHESKDYYFYNIYTKETTWQNPRQIVVQTETPPETASAPVEAPVGEASELTFQARFDRVSGRFIADPNRTVENYSSSARAQRQMSHYFDPSKIPDSGKSLKAERRAQKHTKKELAAFKSKHKARKEQRQRAWLIND